MLLGFIILLIGILYLLESIIPGLTIDFNIIWPSVLIIISIYNVVKEKKSDLFNNIILFVGLFFLLKYMNIINADIEKIFFPLLTIIIGLSIIFKNISFYNKHNIKKIGKDGRLEYNAIFGGVEEIVDVDNFTGAKISSIFGGSELDFSKCKIKAKEIVIDINSIFGGTDIKLPTGCKLIVNSIAVFGGNDTKYISNEDSKIVIYINCYSIFGGAEIK